MRGFLTPFGRIDFTPEDFDLEKFFRGDSALIRSDVKETENSYVVEAELPGFKKEDISITMKDNLLTLVATKNTVVENKGDTYMSKERSSGTYSRSYGFKNVEEKAITAKYEDGILTIELPKKAKDEDKHEISIS